MSNKKRGFLSWSGALSREITSYIKDDNFIFNTYHNFIDEGWHNMAEPVWPV
jgi:hypothetical protein